MKEDPFPSTVAQAVDSFAAYMDTLPSAELRTPSAIHDLNGNIRARSRWLLRMLEWVRATLEDAEDMDLTEDEHICGWLRELQAVSEAAENVLDVLTHEAMRLGLMENGRRIAGSVTEEAVDGTGKAAMVELPPGGQDGGTAWDASPPHDQVRSSSSAPPLLGGEVFDFLSHIEQRMKEIATRFKQIKKPEQVLKLDDRKQRMRPETMSARRASRSVVEEPRIVGRTEELATIKKFLLPSDAEESGRNEDVVDDEVPLMAIVGMGGLGKTTLAQLAFNDDQVKQHFQLKSWVTVSEDFDVIRLTKDILKGLGEGTGGMSQLDLLHRKLDEKLRGKERLLLVLDDVWEVDSLHAAWKRLTAPLLKRSAVTKIIMTTRDSKVPKVVAANPTQLDLGTLSYEQSLELFMHHAFEGRDPNLCRNLVVIGEEIVMNCGGVPLAVKALGGLLSTEEDEEQWKGILRSEAVWNASLNQGESSVIHLLKLSYQHLAAPLKRCFRYCLMIPKNFAFVRDQVIPLWIAQGYIKAKWRRSIEEVGQSYIDDLLSRSFFQKHPTDSELFQMHDLMHDLARSVSQDEHYYLVVGREESLAIPGDVRHTYLSLPDRPVPLSLKADEHSKPKSFRSFFVRGLAVDDIESTVIPTIRLSPSMHSRIEHLRVLDLAAVALSDLPGSINHLKHLRYLSIYFADQIPEILGSLCHLQTLILKTIGRRTLKVPTSISKFYYNLRHLEFRCGGDVQYPVAMGRLTNLHTFPRFHVTADPGCAKLGELKDMNRIRGNFHIKGLENLTDVDEAKKACLDKKIGVQSLRLEWGGRTTDSPFIDDEVLESLRPNIQLRNLEIRYFRGSSHPSWLGGPLFSRLGVVELMECVNWTSLPPLGHLPCLRSLSISGARAVKHIGQEFFSGGFPQLEKLILENMDSWVSWSGAQNGECARLKKLAIRSCPNLESLSLINLGAIEDMLALMCPKLRFAPTDSSLELSHLLHAREVTIWYICEGASISFDLLEAHLKLEKIAQAEAVEYALSVFSDVRQIFVFGCSNLTSLPLGNFGSLKSVQIVACPDLTSLPLGKQGALESVYIQDCPELKLTSISPGLWELPSILKIYVNDIHNAVGVDVDPEKSAVTLEGVDELEASSLLNRFSHMIRGLTFVRCSAWASLPWTGIDIPTLQHLKIEECSSSPLLNGGSLLSTLRRLVVTRCGDLASLPFVDLVNLEYLEISQCPLFKLMDADQLPPRLQVLSIRGYHSYEIERERCHRHQDSLRVIQLRHCSEKRGEDCNLYLMFRGVRDADEAAKLCSRGYINTLEMEWDCCADLIPNAADSAAEVLGKLYLPLDDYDLKKIVIRGYTGSRWGSPLWDPSLPSLISVTLVQCSKCETLPPLSQLRRLRELYVKGAHSLERFVEDEGMSRVTEDHIAFRRLERLEFHDMPMWKEWSGAKEGDFPLLRKLVLKRCPNLKSLPGYLPPSLKELELEACHELLSLYGVQDDAHVATMSLEALCLVRLSVTDCPEIQLSATDSLPATLEEMSLSGCPLLVAWCEAHPGKLEHIPSIRVAGVGSSFS